MRIQSLIIIFCLCTNLAVCASPVWAEDSKKLIEAVKREYKAGNYKKAFRLLKKDMDEHPDNGTTHYYMGLVRKQLGQDMPALRELELAARILPAETLDAYVEQAEKYAKTGNLELPEKPQPKDWLTEISNSVTDFFSGQKKPQKIEKKQSTPWQMPDLMAGADEIYRNARKMIKQHSPKHKRKPGYQSWAAQTMSMADIQDLVRKSKVVNKNNWSSHKEGVLSYRQSPRDTPSWDYWIARYKRSFQYILMSHLAKEGEIRPYGAAACIFSLDNKGNLRGHIYASTASAKLNKCLLKTIKELNHSRVLKFPKDAKVTGYNFQMSWNFGKLLRFISYVRAVKAKRLAMIEAQKAKAEALKLKAEKDAKAKLLAKKKLKAKKARERKLALLRKKRAKPDVIKTKVLGQIIPKPKLVAVKAKQLTLKDVPYSESLNTKGGDPFVDIDDQTIMNWPDVNR